MPEDAVLEIQNRVHAIQTSETADGDGRRHVTLLAWCAAHTREEVCGLEQSPEALSESTFAAVPLRLHFEFAGALHEIFFLELVDADSERSSTLSWLGGGE